MISFMPDLPSQSFGKAGAEAQSILSDLATLREIPYLLLIFRFLKYPSEPFPTHNAIQPFFLVLSWVTVSEGSVELFT